MHMLVSHLGTGMELVFVYSGVCRINFLSHNNEQQGLLYSHQSYRMIPNKTYQNNVHSYVDSLVKLMHERDIQIHFQNELQSISSYFSVNTHG